MSAFVKISSSQLIKSKSPTMTISRRSIYLNGPAQEIANLHVMKFIEVLWDEGKKILLLRPSHVEGAGYFQIRRPNPSTCMIPCPKQLAGFRGEANRIHVPARWDDKEKAFYASLGQEPSE